MTQKPILLFLHGVGDGDQSDSWKAPLSEALADAGYPGLEEARVIAPKYPNTLSWPSDDKESLPRVTIKSASGDAAKRNRRDFERRIGALEIMLGRHTRGTGWALGDVVVDLSLRQKKFLQANRYVSDSQTRARVLNRILRKLPSYGRLVIVGHSLGSVVAADIVRRLPVGIEVGGIITLGSPLANRRFHVDKLRSNLTAPPTNLAWWVNFWNDLDPVTTHRGVSSAFSWVLDHRITHAGLLTTHNVDRYLAQPAVVTAIGYGLFGSQSKALVLASSGIDISPDYAESIALLAFRYAHLMKNYLEGDQRERFEGALREVQATTADLIRDRNAEIGRPISSAIEGLTVDLTDSESPVLEPQPISHLTKNEAIIPLISIAAANVIQPYEIEVSKAKRRQALEQLTLDMKLGSQLGAHVMTSIELAKEAIRDGGSHWFKWTLVGVGAAALIVATGGLAVAASPGLAGAAAVTSALATFGPGGMIGGLLTAGTLASAGGGSIAVGLAAPATTAATAEAIVATQLAAAILKGLQGLEQDPSTWQGLVESEIVVRRDRARLEPFSDESAPTLKALKQKLVAIEGALRYLRQNNLAPGFDKEPGS